MVEDCVGTITGTLFDASDVAGCSPGEIAASVKYGNQPFEINSTPNLAIWPIISASAPTVTTNNNGVYSQSVYASVTPANYIFDYSELIGSGKAAGIKNECGISMVAMTGQGQVVVKNTGFWRLYGGWWQVVGGSVFAEKGITSNIPASVAPTDQKLILAVNGRTGFLSYGVPWTGGELGTNPNIQLPDGVSVNKWRVQSVYEGLRYDYDFYKTRMDMFPQTEWNGDSISYGDNGNGYQIFKHSGNINPLIYDGPAAGEKAILLVDGSVTINSNIDVPDGSFLAIIAKGTITFDPAVTQAEGWFVAENINIPCKQTAGTCDKTDLQFKGQGSFVGWTGITLGRIQPGVENNTRPSELFTFRPDMLINIPTPMKVFTRKFSPFIP